MQNVKTFFSMFGKLIKILDKKQRQQGIVLFFLLMLVSLLEMLGVSVIVPFITTMLEPEKIMSNQYVQPIVQILRITNYKYLMYLLSVAIILIYIVKNGFILWVNYYQSNYRNQLEKDLNVKMLSAYMKQPYSFFTQNNSAEIIRGVDRDMTNVATVVDSYSTIIAEGLTCLTLGIFLIYLSPLMALSLLVIAGITALIIIYGFKEKIGNCGVQSREAFANKYKYLNQTINSIKEIMISQSQKYFIGQYEQAAKQAADCNTKYLWFSKAPNRIIETIFIGGLLLVVTIGYSISISNVAFVTTLGAIGIAAVRILPSISTLTNSMNTLVYMRPSLEEAYSAITGIKIPELEKVNDALGERENFIGNIQIENVEFQYRNDLPLVLNGVKLSISKGAAVAFIGESGAGKSTLADILLGLQVPNRGEVLVDGKNVFSIRKAWSQMIGYVPQMVYLLDDSIKKNVAFGIPEDDIDDVRVWEALEQAQLMQVVKKMEQGLDTVVGERGIKLSGGQRQRIAIARALYRNPDILILDEATSALDSETENAVMDAINGLYGVKTLVIIAHRISTIKRCDYIYEVRNGKVSLKQREEIIGKGEVCRK